MNYSSIKHHGSSRSLSAKGRWPSPYLTEHLAFYGSYHTHPVNQIIHIIFVPVLLFTIMVLFHLYLPSIQIPVKQGDGGIYSDLLQSFVEGGGDDAEHNVITISADFVLYLLYSTLFVVLDPTWIGASTSLYLYSLHYAVQPFCEYCEETAHLAPWKAALALHLLGWYMQIHPGHAVFEKRKPALMDSLVQAFAFAPLFIWYEIIFRLGVRREYQIYLDEVVREKRRTWALEQKQQQK